MPNIDVIIVILNALQTLARASMVGGISCQAPKFWAWVVPSLECSSRWGGLFIIPG